VRFSRIIQTKEGRRNVARVWPVCKFAVCGCRCGGVLSVVCAVSGCRLTAAASVVYYYYYDRGDGGGDDDECTAPPAHDGSTLTCARQPDIENPGVWFLTGQPHVHTR